MAQKKSKAAADQGMKNISLSRSDAMARVARRVIKSVRSEMDELESSVREYFSSRPKHEAQRGKH